jgi:hypothetical protein
MDPSLITGIVTLCTNLATGIVTWLLARRKYNTEVDSNEIENLKKSLEFYEDIVRDNNRKLQFYIKLAEDNRVGVYRLKGIIHRLLNNSCLDNICTKRQFYTEDQIRDILGEIAPDLEEKNIKDGTES